MKLTIHTFDLTLKHTFAISRRSFNHQKTLIVELSQDGLSGYGEATVNPYYPNTEIEVMRKALETIRPQIEAKTADDPARCWEEWQTALSEYPFALCALDVACWDLHARLQQQALYKLWNTEWTGKPISCYTLSIASLEVLRQRMAETPWPVYKIKLGTKDDIGLVESLRKETTARFLVDANAAWSADEAIEKSIALKALGVEFIEQPLAADDWQGMAKLYAHSALPLIADESCRKIADIPRCAECFHGINIKLMKCGGLSPALRMIQQIRNLKLKVMVGCMTESTIGISAIAQLLPQLDYVDMDGPLFLKEDIARGAKVTAKGTLLADENGTGAQPIGQW
ncbi:MAG: dipeptide epimerase [Bacteroidota bacterium]